MTTHELIELAPLHALGLLDEQDTQAFERALASASPEVQASVRREQTRHAHLDYLLPDVEPPAGLRGRVLEAVRRAIAAMGGQRDEHDVLATIGADDAPLRTRLINTGPVWRAACIGFATATVVLSSVLVWASREQQRSQSFAETGALIDQALAQLGPRAQDMILRPSVRRVNMVASAGVPNNDGKLRARLYFCDEQNEAFLICDGLPVAQGEYRLVVRTQSGFEGVDKFEATGGFVPVLVNLLEPQDLSSLSIEGPINDRGDRAVIFTVADAR